MFALYDKVKYIKDSEVYFIVDIEEGHLGTVYGIEKADQKTDDWFRWAEEDDILPIEEI